MNAPPPDIAECQELRLIGWEELDLASAALSALTIADGALLPPSADLSSHDHGLAAFRLAARRIAAFRPVSGRRPAPACQPTPLAARQSVCSLRQLQQLRCWLAGPGDRPIIATASRNVPAAGPNGIAIVSLVALSPSTGKVVSVFVKLVQRYHTEQQKYDADGRCQVLGMDASGQHVLVNCLTFGSLDDNGKFTRLPAGPRYQIFQRSLVRPAR
jgi:hypothetical protein